MTEQKRLVNEDEEGNLCVRAAGGFKLHVIPQSERGNGNDAKALCGHAPNHGGSYHMKRRAKWYHTRTHPLNATCEKCRAAYLSLVPSQGTGSTTKPEAPSPHSQ